MECSCLNDYKSSFSNSKLFVCVTEHWLDQAIGSSPGDYANTDFVFEVTRPVIPPTEAVNYLVDQAVATDRDNSVVVTCLQLCVDNFISMATPLCIRYRNVHMSKSEHRLDLSREILLCNSITSKWVDKQQSSALRWQTLLLYTLVVTKPQNSTTPARCLLDSLEFQSNMFQLSVATSRFLTG